MIKAINTRHKGYNFRSRTEARWAIFFDTLGLVWEYEKEGFVLSVFRGDHYERRMFETELNNLGYKRHLVEGPFKSRMIEKYKIELKKPFTEAIRIADLEVVKKKIDYNPKGSGWGPGPGESQFDKTGLQG